MRNFKFHLILLIALIASSQAKGTPIEPLSNIHQAIQDYYRSELADPIPGQRVTLRLGKLDKRLRLNKCDTPLEIFIPEGTRNPVRFTLGVKCLGPKIWNIYVPVQLSVFEKVLVAAKPLRRGEVISESHLKMAEINVAKQRTRTFKSKDEIIGSRVKRPLNLNGLIRSRDICMICKGQQVTLVAQSSELQVKMKGKALKDGMKGDLILIKNLKSKRQIEGIVLAPGLVEVSI